MKNILGSKIDDGPFSYFSIKILQFSLIFTWNEYLLSKLKPIHTFCEKLSNYFTILQCLCLLQYSPEWRLLISLTYKHMSLYSGISSHGQIYFISTFAFMQGNRV